MTENRPTTPIAGDPPSTSSRAASDGGTLAIIIKALHPLDQWRSTESASRAVVAALEKADGWAKP